MKILSLMGTDVIIWMLVIKQEENRCIFLIKESGDVLIYITQYLKDVVEPTYHRFESCPLSFLNSITMVDNFEQISNLLNFESEDDFYFLQIIQRKKDNPNGYMGSNNSSRLIKAYYIKSVEELNNRKNEIIELCKLFNARAGINLNKRSFYKTSFNVLKRTAEYLHNRDFKSTAYVWNTECGRYNGGDKIWLLDVDDKDNWNLEHDLIKFIRRAQPHNCKKIIAKIPSKNGYHFITKGFDLRGFKKSFPNVEIHKNNPTSLFIP